MLRAVLDACTLVPSLQRDFLLQLATEEAFAPVWGTGIVTELDYILARLHERRGVSDSEDRRHHLLTQMKRAFPGSKVRAPKERAYDYGPDDPDDEANIEAIRAAEFVRNTVSTHPEAGVKALVAMPERRTNPPQAPEQILDLLVKRYGMDEAAGILRPLLVASC